MPDPRIVSSMAKFRAALLNAEQASAGRLVDAYGRIYAKLQTDMRALEADIADLGDAATAGKVRKLARYNALIEQTATEMDKYAAVLENEVAGTRAQAVADALTQNRALIQAALPNLPPAVQEQLLASFNKLNPAAVENLLGALTDGPLQELLQTFGQQAALDLGQAILDGVALGYSPQKVAARMAQIFGGNLTRALTIARTEVLRAYRTANLENYRANNDVVKGWRWSAEKDDVCCLACLALDGQEFPLDETFMPSHPNCRCAPEPITVSYKDLGLDVPDVSAPRQSGKQWLESLPDSEQQKFFSKAAYRAYKDGAVKLDDFIGTQESKDWGPSYVERSLKSILGDGVSKYMN